MHPIWRVAGIIVVFVIASIGWVVLGGVMSSRNFTQSARLEGNVAELWGRSQEQQAPSFTFIWKTRKYVEHVETENGREKIVRHVEEEVHQKTVSPSSSTIAADFELDQRRKGLMWYSLYNLDFDGAWTYDHEEAVAGTLRIQFTFPDEEGMYDDFRFVVNGTDRAPELRPDRDTVSLDLDIEPGQEITLATSYRTRGMNDWRYVPGTGMANLERFRLTITTDFAAIDFPSYSMSPSSKTRTADGWKLDWNVKQLITGHTMGIVMPERIQPGQLAASLSFSAPISLFFFFLIVFVLSMLRRIDIHPVNYLFIAAAFFAFHLLFGYSVDHIRVVTAFAVSSAVSILLVVTYLRLVVSNRFAFVEAAAAQLVYLVGFSLAHFWEGFTGLTVTVLSILTLFLLMQMTGRMRWSEVLARKAAGAKP